MSKTTPNSDRRPISRLAVGLITIGCFVAAGFLWSRESSDDQTTLWIAGFIRAGSLMAAFWLALPTKNKPAAWAQVSKKTFAGIILAVGAMAARPRVFVPLFAVVLALAFFLRPGRARHRPNRDSWED
jgi:hypothetical protein